ncbi:hypothetical protein HDU90_008195 [Geranomyces variabilis]|nr:hypothetical protein HDU90_008195 [Geranomyces variabilis]
MLASAGSSSSNTSSSAPPAAAPSPLSLAVDRQQKDIQRQLFQLHQIQEANGPVSPISPTSSSSSTTHHPSSFPDPAAPIAYSPRDSSLTSNLANVFRKTAHGSKNSLNRLASISGPHGPGIAAGSGGGYARESYQSAPNMSLNRPPPDPRMASDFEALLMSNETKKLTSTPDQMQQIEVDDDGITARGGKLEPKSAVAGDRSEIDGLASHKGDATHWAEFLKNTEPQGATPAVASSRPTPPPGILRTPPGPRPDPIATAAAFSSAAAAGTLPTPPRSNLEDSPNLHTRSVSADRPQKPTTNTQSLADFLRNTEPPMPAAPSKKEKTKRAAAAMRLLSNLQAKTSHQMQLLNKSGSSSSSSGARSAPGFPNASTPDLRQATAGNAKQASAIPRYTMISIPNEPLRRNAETGTTTVTSPGGPRGGGTGNHTLLMVGSRPLPVPPTEAASSAPTSPTTTEPGSSSGLRDSIRKLAAIDPKFATLERLADQEGVLDVAPAAESATLPRSQEESQDTEPGLVGTATTTKTVSTSTIATQTIHPVLVAETEYIFDTDGDENGDGGSGASSADEGSLSVAVSLDDQSPLSPGAFVDTHACASCGVSSHISHPSAIICASIVEDVVSAAVHAAELGRKDREIEQLEEKLRKMAAWVANCVDATGAVVEDLTAKHAGEIAQVQARAQAATAAAASAAAAAPRPNFSKLPPPAAPVRNASVPHMQRRAPPPPPSLSPMHSSASAPTSPVSSAVPSPPSSAATTPIPYLGGALPALPPPPPRHDTAAASAAAVVAATTATASAAATAPPSPPKSLYSPSSSPRAASKMLASPAIEMNPPQAIISEDIRLALPEVSTLGSLGSFESLFDDTFRMFD